MPQNDRTATPGEVPKRVIRLLAFHKACKAFHLGFHQSSGFRGRNEFLELTEPQGLGIDSFFFFFFTDDTITVILGFFRFSVYFGKGFLLVFLFFFI